MKKSPMLSIAFFVIISLALISCASDTELTATHKYKSIETGYAEEQTNPRIEPRLDSGALSNQPDKLEVDKLSAVSFG